MLRAARQRAVVNPGQGATHRTEWRDIPRRWTIDTGCHDESCSSRGDSYQRHDCEDNPKCHVGNSPILLMKGFALAPGCNGQGQPRGVDLSRVQRLDRPAQPPRRADVRLAAQRVGKPSLTEEPYSTVCERYRELVDRAAPCMKSRST